VNSFRSVKRIGGDSPLAPETTMGKRLVAIPDDAPQDRPLRDLESRRSHVIACRVEELRDVGMSRAFAQVWFSPG
jgi:hypothetical protein